MKFEIVKATTEMVDDMGRIHTVARMEVYKNLVPESFLASITAQSSAQKFKEAIMKEEDEFYVFKLDGEPAGIAILYQRRKSMPYEIEGEIYAIYFHPKYWGTKYTHKAFQFCIDRIKMLGYKQIYIWVLDSNFRARSFYEKYDFQLDGAKKNVMLGKPMKAVRYTKIL